MTSPVGKEMAWLDDKCSEQILPEEMQAQQGPLVLMEKGFWTLKFDLGKGVGRNGGVWIKVVVVMVDFDWAFTKCQALGLHMHGFN